MASLPIAAAYHGDGWRPRTGTHMEDVREGLLWQPDGADSEWATLDSVLLALPQPDWPEPADWNDALYLAPVRFRALRDELVRYARTLTELGVRVTAGELPPGGPGGPPYNGIFVRDQFFMTPQGAVVARMGSHHRAAEARWAAAALAARGVPILHTIRGGGCFEGADALWLNQETVLIGLGNRTNEAGADQLAVVLAEQGVATRRFRLPSQVQHLLGLLQVVDRDLAVVRTELAPAGLLDALAEIGLEIVEVAESEAVTTGQAMNLLTIGPRTVVLVGGWPDIRDRLADRGVAVAACVDCPELVKCAGGLACATGILCRVGSTAPVGSN
jgi:N-dimethylarginine dimethylaminohydrolase